MAQKQIFWLLLWHCGLLFQTVTQVRCPETMHQRWLRYTKVTEGTCVRAVQVPTLITFTHTCYHDKSNSDRYSLQTVNRKLWIKGFWAVCERDLEACCPGLLRIFCTLSKALNPQLINWFYFKQTVLITLNCGQELNHLKILKPLLVSFST